MSRAWSREDRPDLAIEKILEAAEKAFIELGVSAAGMAEVADFAGCSRGTLYRYFKSRHELHLAYVNHAAQQISDRVQSEISRIEDPRERLAQGVLSAIREVRGSPGTAAWFEPGAAGMAARMSRSSEVVETLAARFVSALLGPRQEDPEGHLLADWLVRVIVSLLAMPGKSPAEERKLVERFVAPALSPRSERSRSRRRA